MTLRRPLGAVPEALAVLASPIVLFFGLRLRGMAPAFLPDPSISSTYIFAPRSFFARYTPALAATARLREGARVGFLVPARLAYLIFGAVPGFFALRYVLVLVALVPTYVLVRRCYGIGAGALAVAVLMCSPVLVTAWGTDFPDSAVVSYLTGGLACLVMPVATRRGRIALLAGAATLFTLAVWALATSALLIATALAVYLVVRLVRTRRHLVADVVVLAAVALATTAALGVASWLELGQLDYIRPTIDALRFLARPAQEQLWHSTNWRWAPYDAYLLVPPAVLGTWLIAFGRRRGPLGTPQLVIGATLAAQLAVSIYAQFANHVQLLEEHYFSSTLLAAVSLALIVTIAELTRPLAIHRWARFAPAALVVAVALGYEVDPHVAALRWFPLGFVLAAVVVGGALIGRALATDPRRTVAWIGGGCAVVVMSAAALVLTVAPSPTHAALPGTVFDPITTYDGALGGSAGETIADYRLSSEVPSFVGPGTYRGERLLTCWSAETPLTLSVLGLYHGAWNKLPGYCPRVGPPAVAFIEQRSGPQLLVLSETPMDLPVLMTELDMLRPDLVRHTVLRSGPYQLDLWLLDIGRYTRAA